MAANPVKIINNKLSAPFSFSQSSLKDYDDCQRRFQLRYIQQLKWPAVETAPILENELRQKEGKQFHRMVQQLLIGLPIEKLTYMAENSGSENLSRWWHNFITSSLEFPINLESNTIHPEYNLSAPVGNHRIMAKYDLVFVKDGKTIIYDWKTYHKRPRNETMVKSFQTRVYLSLLVIAGWQINNQTAFHPDQLEMIYWYADFPDEPTRIQYDSQQFNRDWNEAKRLVEEISVKQSFPLTEDDKKCGYCLYRSFCERGLSAAEQDELNSLGDEPETSWDLNMEQIQEIEF